MFCPYGFFVFSVKKKRRAATQDCPYINLSFVSSSHLGVFVVKKKGGARGLSLCASVVKNKRIQNTGDRIQKKKYGVNIKFVPSLCVLVSSWLKKRDGLGAFSLCASVVKNKRIQNTGNRIQKKKKYVVNIKFVSSSRPGVFVVKRRRGARLLCASVVKNKRIQNTGDRIQKKKK